MTTTEATGTHVLLRTMEAVELARVTDNPWQPRTALDPNAVKEIADSIREVGLLQPPLVRQAGAGYQVAFGHYRVAALKLLGIETMELEVRALTDAEMAIIALTENGKRRDVKPIEQYRAWQKALEIDGMTVAMLATSLGLDHSTVSNSMRLLKLPAWVLEHVDGGELSAHAAREFLCLMGSDGHFHEDVAKQVLNKMMSGIPDWRAARVRMEIDNCVNGRPVSEWRKLFKGYAGGGHMADPTFDVAKFKEDQAARVHTLPNDEWTDGVWRDGMHQPGKVKKEASRDWTCATSPWTTRQNAGKAAAAGVVAAAGKAKPSNAPVKTSNFTKVLAADPVFLGVSPETAGPLLKAFEKDGLNEDAAAALGTRGTPVLIDKSKTVFKASVDARSVDVYGFNLTAVPSYFDNIDECRKTCTIGATYGQLQEKGAFYLFCLNQQHFEEKVAKGRTAITRKVEKRRTAQDEQDAKVYAALSSVAGQLPATVTTILAALLLDHRGRFEAIVPEGVSNWQEREELQLWPSNTERLAALLGQTIQRDWLDSDKAIKTVAGMSPQDVHQLLLRLMVEDLRSGPLASFAKALEAAPAVEVSA